MSRYLKDVSATQYRYKKYYSVAGDYTITIPNGVKAVKSLVFGGGGCSCTYNICSCTLPATGFCCCYCCVRGHYSGAGGGFTEKTWNNVGGLRACICVAAAEGTSFVCFAGLGCTYATGGTSGTTGTAGAGGYRIQCGGQGYGGDFNSCGSPGYIRCTCYFCRYDLCGTRNCVNSNSGPAICCPICSCYYTEMSGVHLPGGTPGTATCNRTSFADDTLAIQRCCCYYLSWGYNAGNNGGDSPSVWYSFAGYYCTKCAYTGDLILSCTYCTVPGACWAFPIWYCTSVFPQGPISCLDPYYDYSWDVIGNACCACCRACCNASGSYTSSNSSGGWGAGTYYCCYYNCLCYHQRNNEATNWTALNSPGYGCNSPGAVGGGGAGMWYGDEVRALSNYDRAGACGLVILHY